jgi:hypothetical protein
MYSPCVGLSVRIALFFQNGATWKKMVISRIFFLEKNAGKIISSFNLENSERIAQETELEHLATLPKNAN